MGDAGPSLEWRQAGFHGKLPVRGDFVTRDLPWLLADALDRWLQDGISASQAELGERWVPLFLDCPIWHFAIAGGVILSTPVTGLITPSVDLVGRYFPLVIAAPLPASASLLESIDGTGGWHVAAAAAALMALDEMSTLESVEREVAALGAPPAAMPSGGGRPDSCRTPAAASRCFTSRQLHDRHGALLSLWWTDGSDRMAPTMLAASGLPVAEAFASLMDGYWPRIIEQGITCLSTEAAV